MLSSGLQPGSPGFASPRRDQALPWVEASPRQAFRGRKEHSLITYFPPVWSSLGLEAIVTQGQKEKLNIAKLSKQESLIFYAK